MAAGSASDIPDSKSDYCPCNRCTLARKQGREEIINLVRELHKEYPGENFSFCEHCEDSHAGSGMMLYPCPTIKALEGNSQ